MLGKRIFIAQVMILEMGKLFWLICMGRKMQALVAIKTKQKKTRQMVLTQKRRRRVTMEAD